MGRGGGVGVLFRGTLQINNSICDTRKTFKLMGVRFGSSVHLRVFVIYQPPESTYALFHEEFSRLLETTLAEHPGPIIFIGDVNLHVDDPNDYYARRFANILGAFDLKQHVRVITHKDGHTHDLVITRCDDSLVQNTRVCDPAISDHRGIFIAVYSGRNQCLLRKLFKP